MSEPVYVVWSSYNHLSGNSPAKLSTKIHIRKNDTHSLCNREFVIDPRPPTPDELKKLDKCKLCQSAFEFNLDKP